jgi:hypothetical protein
LIGKLTNSLADLAHLQIISELNQVMLSTNQVSSGLSTIINNASQSKNGKTSQNEIDEIFIFKLLKSYKENKQSESPIFYEMLRVSNPRLFMYILQYF